MGRACRRGGAAGADPRRRLRHPAHHDGRRQRYQPADRRWFRLWRELHRRAGHPGRRSRDRGRSRGRVGSPDRFPLVPCGHSDPAAGRVGRRRPAGGLAPLVHRPAVRCRGRHAFPAALGGQAAPGLPELVRCDRRAGIVRGRRGPPGRLLVGDLQAPEDQPRTYRPAAPPGVPRRAHRPGQPGAVHRTRGQGGRADPSRRLHRRAALRRPGRLQIRQRQPGPPDRRPTAGGRRRAATDDGAHAGIPRPAGRRRVRPAHGRRRGRGRAPGTRRRRGGHRGAA